METGVSVDQRDGAVIVSARGEVDMDVAPDVMAAIDPYLGVADHLVVDLSEVTFMDSSGLGVLVASAQRVGDGRLTVVVATDRVRRVMEISGLNQLIPVVDTLQAALER